MRFVKDSNSSNLSPQDEEMTNKLKNTTWRFEKSVTYYKNTGQTKTDTNQYGTISFRSSFNGSSTLYRVLTINGSPFGIWRFENGELRIGYSSTPTTDQANLLPKICMGGSLDQLNSSTLVTTIDLESIRTTYYYTRE